MAHGYMREYDDDRGNERDRWSDDNRERAFRGPNHDRNERNLNFMLGDRDRDRDWEPNDRLEGGAWERSPRNFRSSQDEHYRSWRDRQMEALDRDYADYCREREQQFHQDFDSWRRSRRGNPEPLQAGMTQTGLASDPTGELQLTADEAVAPATGPDPMATATLGTSSSRSRR